MKRLGRVLGSLLAVALTVASLHAVAATEAQTGTREFNHMSTGFALTGGHASAACETCHMGGVFKGTPRTCDGCHAVGRRIVATPKSNTHIVTDAPCETCHFNTATWLGARYNHGTARTGECASCHNGRISTGKHAGHIPTTYSCDKCHRTSSWIPASWNHTDTASDCSTCHKAGGPGRNYSASHMSQAAMNGMGLSTCRGCHKNYYSFYGAFYDHVGASLNCDTCHGASAPTGVKTKMTVPAIHNTAVAVGITNCLSCHKTNYAVGSFALGKFDHVTATPCATCHSGTNSLTGKTGSHTTTAKSTLACGDCHYLTTSWLPASYHRTHPAAPSCSTCHDGAYAIGKPAGHIATTDECSQCHFGTAAWKPALGAKPANHIPYNAGVTCNQCHVGLGLVNPVTLHTYSVSAVNTCTTCHITPTPYAGNNQKTRRPHDGSSGSNCTGCHEHSSAGSYGKW